MSNQNVIDEIKGIIDNLAFGSVEVIVQDGQVTQISTRIIRKTHLNSKRGEASISKNPTRVA